MSCWWSCCRHRWFGRIAFPQQSAGNTQGSLGLFDIDGFGQDEVSANAKRLGNPGLTFHDSYGKRRLVGRRVTRALEQQCGILLVIAVDHDGVEVLAHQLLDCGKRFGAGLDVELELAQDLGHCAGSFFVGTEEESLVTHTK